MKVMAFGTFDLFHRGHEHYLREAASYGDLTVIVAREETIVKIKGRKPVDSEEKRIRNIVSFGVAKRVVLGNSKNYLQVIDEFKPDIICFGYDQNSFTKEAEEYISINHLGIKIVRAKPFQEKKYKSSKLRKNESK